ncbi:MAG: OmpA family protein [Flavobacteriales bacterium]|nr:OmpA family protein [Flavobacteriales bacterium]
MKKAFLLYFSLLMISMGSFAQCPDPGYKSFDNKEWKVGDMIILQDILYSIGGGNHVLPESRDLIKQLADFLKAHPSLTIEVGNHTDSRGSAAYNENLSLKRSESLKYELTVKYEIDESRITAKGYGESQLRVSDEEVAKAASDQEKEELHQCNRRTVITITGL